MNERRRVSTSTMISWLIAAMIVVVLALQTRSLYIFPQPDGARWWGDETPQMLELRAEIQHGYAFIPTALGASVGITNGLIRGNSWLAAVLYGLPVAVLDGSASVVSIGRTITFILSLLLLVVMYRMMRAFGVASWAALAAILLLVSTRSSFFASHAARLDIAAGLAVLGFAWYLATRYERLRDERWAPTPAWFFLYSVVAFLFATLSIHLLTLLASLSVYALWRFRAFRHPTSIVAALSGVVLTLAILLSVYALSGAPISLYSPSLRSNQFQSVIGGLPILRPFSRSVQVANILERLHGLWLEAPAFFALLAIALVLVLATRKKDVHSPAHSFIAGAAIAIAASWLLLQSPALYYYPHVLPLFILALTIIIIRRIREGQLERWIALAACIGLSFFAVRDASTAQETSALLERDNKASLSSAMASIHSDSANVKKPIVLAQNPAIAFIERQSDVRPMSAHLVSFPYYDQPLGEILQRVGARYLLLYRAHDGADYAIDYHDLKPVADSLGTVMQQSSGLLFDVHRDYFDASTFLEKTKDTLTLYRLPALAR